jgi:hypothetical protein
VPESLVLSPMIDTTYDRVGFPLDHPYIENVWLPVLGPTSVLLLRRAGTLLEEHPNGVRLDLVELSRSFGLGPKPGVEEVGRHAPIRRTLDRVVQFRLGSWLGDDRLGVYTKVPAVSRSQAERLPESVRVVHDRLLDDHLGRLATSKPTATRLTAVGSSTETSSRAIAR